MIWAWLTKQTIEKITTKFTSWQGVRCVYVLRTGFSVSSIILGFAGWRSRWFRRRLLFMYNYLLSPHLTRCYGLLRTILFKLYVFRPYNFSFIVCPSVLDDLPPLVAVASSSSCPDLLRVFNYIVKVSKNSGVPSQRGSTCGLLRFQCRWWPW